MSLVGTQGAMTPTLDGYDLAGVSADDFTVSRNELKGNVTAANASVREQRPAPLDGFALVTYKHTFGLAWSHIAKLQEAVESRLAFPGVHRLCLWKHLTSLGWYGDGVRDEFFLPPSWRIATHTLVPPNGLSADRFEPSVRVGLAGDPLVVQHVSTATYDADPTPAGEVWFEEETTRFRLGTPPPLDSNLVVTVVPVVLCLTAGEPESRQYRDPIREPRRIVLVEI